MDIQVATQHVSVDTRGVSVYPRIEKSTSGAPERGLAYRDATLILSGGILGGREPDNGFGEVRIKMREEDLKRLVRTLMDMFSMGQEEEDARPADLVAGVRVAD